MLIKAGGWFAMALLAFVAIAISIDFDLTVHISILGAVAGITGKLIVAGYFPRWEN